MNSSNIDWLLGLLKNRSTETGGLVGCFSNVIFRCGFPSSNFATMSDRPKRYCSRSRFRLFLEEKEVTTKSRFLSFVRFQR